MTTDITKPEYQPVVPFTPSDSERSFFEQQPEDPFLPSVKLIQGISPETERGARAGDWWLSVRDKPLGPKFLCSIWGRRAHALMIVSGKKTKESYNSESPIFREIMSTPGDGQTIITSWSIGDFLVYLPEHDEFGSLFFGRKSSRPAAFIVIDHMTPPDQRKPQQPKLDHTHCFEISSTVKSFGPKNRCYVPEIKPLERTETFLPDKTALEAALGIFYGPVKNEIKVEVAPSGVDR